MSHVALRRTRRVTPHTTRVASKRVALCSGLYGRGESGSACARPSGVYPRGGRARAGAAPARRDPDADKNDTTNTIINMCERALLWLTGKEIKENSKLRHEWERSALAVVVRRPLPTAKLWVIIVRCHTNQYTSSMANRLVDRRHHSIARSLPPCESSVAPAHTACSVAYEDPLKVSETDQWKTATAPLP